MINEKELRDYISDNADNISDLLNGLDLIDADYLLSDDGDDALLKLSKVGAIAEMITTLKDILAD